MVQLRGRAAGPRCTCALSLSGDLTACDTPQQQRSGVRNRPQPGPAAPVPLTRCTLTPKIVQSALHAVPIRSPDPLRTHSGVGSELRQLPRLGGCARTSRSCSRPQTTARGTSVPTIEENHEQAHVPAEQSSSRPEARLPRPHEHSRRPRDPERTSFQGPLRALRLSRTVDANRGMSPVAA